MWCCLYRNGFFVQSYSCSQLHPFSSVRGIYPKSKGGKKGRSFVKADQQDHFQKQSKVKTVSISVHTQVCYSFLLTRFWYQVYTWVKSNWALKKMWAPEPMFNFWYAEPYLKMLVVFSPVSWGYEITMFICKRAEIYLRNWGFWKTGLFAWLFHVLWSQKQKAVFALSLI